MIECFPEKIAKKVSETNAKKGSYKTQMLEVFSSMGSFSYTCTILGVCISRSWIYAF